MKSWSEIEILSTLEYIIATGVGFERGGVEQTQEKPRGAGSLASSFRLSSRGTPYKFAMMLLRDSLLRPLSWLILASTLYPWRVLGGDILATDGFSTCLDNDKIHLSRMNIQYDKATNQLTFDIAGTSQESQNVTAVLTVTAYGKQLDKREFNFCEEGIQMLCPGTIVFSCGFCVQLY